MITKLLNVNLGISGNLKALVNKIKKTAKKIVWGLIPGHNRPNLGFFFFCFFRAKKAF